MRGVRHRPADGHPAARLGAAVPGRDVDRGLGGPVEVVQLDAGQSRDEAPPQLRRQRLAARDHPPQRGQKAEVRLIEERLEHGGDEVGDGDPLFGDRPGQIGRVLMAAGPGDHQPRALDQRPEELPDRDVEAEAGSSAGPGRPPPAA